MPVYNAERYLRRAIESVINQTHSKLEFILVNDGSTDDSVAICNEYAMHDMRIRVFTQENAGVSAARNVGIDVALGEWIGFVDSDDWVEPDMFEKLLSAAISYNTQIAVCGYEKQHINKQIELQAHKEIPAVLSGVDALEFVLRPNIFEGFMCNKLFNNKFFQSGNGRLDATLHFCEDLALVTEIFIQSPFISYVPEPLYHYCINAHSSMMALNPKRETELIARKRVLELVEYDVPQYKDYAKRGYVNAAVGMLFMVGKYGEYRPGLKRFLRKEGFRYWKAYFMSKKVKLKIKIRAVLVLLFPRLCAVVWGKIKQWRST